MNKTEVNTSVLNVMHITYDMRIGGTEMVIKSIIEGIHANRIKQSIFCIEEPLGPWGQKMQTEGTSIFTANRRPGFDLSLIKAIKTKIKLHKIDIVHCHQYTPWVYGTLAALFTPAKVVFTEHGRFYPDYKSSKRRWINPILNAFTKQITSISEATAHALENYEYLSKEKIQVLYNGISDDIPTSKKNLHDELSLAPGTIILGCIARFDPIKNHLMMLEGLSLAIRDGIKAHLVIVGDGEMRSQIENKVNELALKSHVTLTGYQSEPFAYLNAMDIFLLTSFSEGTSMTLLEAMRASKPCIVTNVGGNPEVIKDGENGIVVPNDDAKALSQAISSLGIDKTKHKMMSTAAKKRFDELFDADAMCSQYLSLYAKVTGKH